METTLPQEAAEILGAMAFSAVFMESFEHYRRLVLWHRICRFLGIRIPIFLLHDLGALLSATPGGSCVIMERREVLRRFTLSKLDLSAIVSYRHFLVRLSEMPAVQRIASWRLDDRVLGILLAKILKLPQMAWASDGGKKFDSEARLSYFPEATSQHANAFAAGLAQSDSDSLLEFVRFLHHHELLVSTSINRVDIDTLRLLAAFPSRLRSPMEDLADLWRLFSAPQIADVVSFSMELLPSLYETKHPRAEQSFSINGVAGLARSGSLDTLLPTELAWDQEIFLQKLLDQELYYTSRLREEPRREHASYLLVDSSASMRGRRFVFARGLALALAKRSLLKGHHVLFRYFDARLHQLFDLASSEFNLPAAIGIEADGPRDMARCFQELLVHLDQLKRTEPFIEVVMITHHECSLPADLLLEARKLARIVGIILFPSRIDIAPANLHLLDRYRIVQEQDLRGGARRVASARAVLEEFS